MRALCILMLTSACTWETDLASGVDASRSLLVTENLPAITLDDALRGAPSPWRSADYRLLAVVNRTDLSEMPDRAADGGEGRLVFGHVRERRTIIVEYAQPGAAKTWASKWLGLDGSAAALAAIVRDFGPIAQVRTAEDRDGVVVLHEYDARLVEGRLRNEPDYARVSFEALASYARSEADALAEGTAVMPREWWATSAVVAPPPAAVPAAVANETCTGCHAKTSSGFQIDPRGRVSTFLSDPSAPADELRRRAAWLNRAREP